MKPGKRIPYNLGASKVGLFKPMMSVVLAYALLPFNMAYGHAFGQRFDLPIPLEYYLTGAAGVVFFSFILVALFSKIPVVNNVGYPHINLFRWSWLRALSDARLVNLLRFIVVVIFVLTVLAGLLGTQSPRQNIMPTMLWIIWWTGMAYFCALITNLWALINPWNTLFLWGEAICRRVRSRKMLFSLNWNYPQWLGVWPACLLFGVFIWGELIWTANAIPANLSYAVIVYSCITWLGMFIFGRQCWLEKGEVFALVFGLFSYFSPLNLQAKSMSGPELTDDIAGPISKQWHLRPYGAGLLTDKKVSPSLMVFILLMLSTVTFDGVMGTPLWREIVQSMPDWHPIQPLLFRMEMWDISRELVLSTLGLILFPLCFGGLYLFFSWLIKITAPFSMPVDDGQIGTVRYMSTMEVGAYFVLSLVPIALAYHLAHYASFLLTVGQLIIPLISDPFGMQWDLFGTADYRVNIAIVGARFVWNISIVSIVMGHIIAVYLSHFLALRVLKNMKQALLSQIPMLVLMIFYTIFSLWILAQPLVE